jgi:heptosyltransferase-1
MANVPHQPERILIIKPSSLGDVVTALPVLRGLRRAFPQAHIAWLLARPFAPLLEEQADLDEIVLFDRKTMGRTLVSMSAAKVTRDFLRQLRRGAYDWVIDLQGLLRTGLFARFTGAPLRAGFADAREGAWLCYNRRIEVAAEHTVERNVELVRALGVEADVRDMTLTVSPQARQFASETLTHHGLRRGGYAVCFLSTRWPTKMYPVRHWRELLTRAIRSFPLVLMGTASEAQSARELASSCGEGIVNLVGATDIPQMVAIVEAAGAVVCPDSAANFIGPAVGVGVVTLMGPTRPTRTGPGNGGAAIAATTSCQGCLRKKCAHVACMQSIAPWRVAEALEALMNKAGA